MKPRMMAAFTLLLLIAVVCVSGCSAPSTSNEAQAGFAPGAFPPTLTDVDYHTDAWTRDDCLTCHEKGVNDAPQMRHTSLPPLAKDGKCRSCHVLIHGQKPAK